MTSAIARSHRPSPGIPWRFLLWGLFVAAVLHLGGCGGGSQQRDTAETGPGYRDFGSDQFPVPAEIQPNVDFWRHVYGVWSRSQVAIHDDKYMGVIYEVAALPGFQSEGYSATQKDFIASRKAYYVQRAAELESKVRSRASLTPDEQQLLAKFEKAGGPTAVYGASERVRSQRGLREKFRRGLEIGGRYDQSFREVMRAHGLPEDLAYLPHVESSFQTNAVSSAGAAGVWQFMPSTGKIYMNVNSTVDERLDPIICANAAARYLSGAHDRLGNWPLAITSYNHGVGGINKARQAHGSNIGTIVKNYGGPAFGFASRNYYAEFIAAREVAKNANRYFPEGVHYEQPWPHDRLVLRSSTTPQQLASQYGVSATTLASLNLHWRSGAREGRAALPAGSTVWLPAGSLNRKGVQPASYSEATMVAQTQPRPEPRREAPPAPKPRPEPVMAAAAPVEREIAPARSAWGGGSGIIASAAADELPAPVAESGTTRSARAARDDIAIPSRAKPSQVAESTPEPKPSRVAESRPEPKPVRVAESKPEPKPKAEPKPEPSSAKVAQSKSKAEAKPAETKVAQSKTKPESKTAKSDKSQDKDAKVAQTKSKPESKDAKLAKTDKADDDKAAKGATKFHVVKPQETLYRVATLNGMSVEELRRLNKMGPKDNSIRPGQKLKVNI